MKERKIFELIKNLNRILLELNPEKDVILSIVDLRLPERKGILKIWLSVFPKEKENFLIKYFRKSEKKIRNRLKEFKLRHLPQKIEILPSSIFNEAGEVFNLLRKIKDEIEKEENKKEG